MHVLIFLLGIIIGSFLNVCICRIPLNQSVLFPRSHCFDCNTRLGAFDLVPVLSFFFSGGRCRYCGNKISIQYPLIEFFNGLFYMLTYIKFGYGLQFIQFSILCSLLIVAAAIDYYHQIIPDIINVFGAICAAAFHIITFNGLSDFLQYILGFLIGGGFLLVVSIITYGGMGGGDIKLMAVLGLWLGYKPVLFILFLSFFLGGIVSVMLILFKLKSKRDIIVFGPFIALSAIMTVLCESYISYHFMI